MKLRNKKTGRIYEPPIHSLCGKDYETLAEICEEWEDYEEPKPQVVYYIDRDGDIVPYKNVKYPKRVFNAEQNKEIGNYFETEEEAEKAVEKLKAWKRLKDKGFKFTGINDDEDSQELITQCGILCEADIYHLEKDADFLLLFGGEE